MSVVIPTSLAGAVAALGEHPGATVLAGGTDLMVAVNDGRQPGVDEVVAIGRVPELQATHVEEDALVIGAAVTYARLTQPELVLHAPALASAARTVGSPQIRNAGTIGGNLATASPAGDTLPVLVALGASLDLLGPRGARRLGVEEFLVGPKRTALEPGELIVAVRVPIRRGPQDYLKVGVRNAMVIAVASVALSIDLDARRVGVGLGSVGPTALPAPDACAWLESRLEWQPERVVLGDPGDLVTFGAMVGDACAAIDDRRGTAAYRRRAVETLSSRALRRAIA